ncbi:hypothetical protein ACFY2Y_02680 [Janibacter hoylei]|uniref:hypothetical protein n=1 Tax=Janibacter hoylei TaxID=364298 RepID=UPI0036B6A388
MTHWRIAHGVAWVGDADRVALVDTRRGAQAVPMHVQAPFATLWTALEGGQVAQADLEIAAAGVVDEGEEAAFVASFVESLSSLGVVEEVTS